MSEFKFQGKGNQVWDKDSLKRALVRDYPGARTVQEALAQAIKEKKEIPKTENSLTEDSDPALIFEQAKRAIEAVFDENVDYEKLYPDKYQEIAQIELKTPSDVFKWQALWLELIDEHNRF